MTRQEAFMKSMLTLSRVNLTPAEFSEISIKQISINNWSCKYTTVITYKSRNLIAVTSVRPNGEVKLKTMRPKEYEESLEE